MLARAALLTGAASLATSLLGAAPASGAPAMWASAATPSSIEFERGPETQSSLDRRLTDPRIVESSGLARSHRKDGRLWTHNDSGGGDTIFAIGPSGRTIARFTLSGASHKDWEAMASVANDGKPLLYVGDIGDNGKKRASIFVHKVREPKPDHKDRSLKPTTYEFRYPDGRHNAEGMMVRPGSKRIYIVTKSKGSNGAVYRAPANPSTSRVNVLTRVGVAPPGMSDAVFLKGGAFMLRGYVSGWVYRDFGRVPVRFPLPLKGESVARGFNRHVVYVGSEKSNSPIYKVRLP